MTRVFTNKRAIKKCIIAIAAFAALILIFYWASGSKLYYEEWNSNVPDAQEQITVMHDGRNAVTVIRLIGILAIGSIISLLSLTEG